MPHWSKVISDVAQEESYKKDTATAPYSGTIQTVDSDGEKLVIDSYAGTVQMDMPTVFNSGSSWIRAVPGAGTTALLQRGADTMQPELVRFASTTGPALVNNYNSAVLAIKKNSTSTSFPGATNYRNLKGNEIQIASAGFAESYYSIRGTLAERAGILTREAVQDDLEILDRAPLHRRVLTNLYKYGSIGDEERFGVVKRPSPTSPFYKDLYVRLPNPAGPGIVPRAFAKEYLRVLKYDSLPNVLVDHREGHVFDDSVTPLVPLQARSTKTGQALRARSRYFTSLTGTKLEMAIDELGNLTLDLPPEAIFGTQVTIPLGNFKLTTGLDFQVTSVKNMTFACAVKWAANSVGGFEFDTAADFLVAATGNATIQGVASASLSSPNSVTLASGPATMTLAPAGIDVSGPGIVFPDGTVGVVKNSSDFTTWITNVNAALTTLGQPVAAPLDYFNPKVLA